MNYIEYNTFYYINLGSNGAHGRPGDRGEPGRPGTCINLIYF